MGRYALLVATGHYADPKLSRLRGPSQDVTRLRAVLADADRGEFDDVRVLQDAADHEIRAAVDDLLSERFVDDLVLLYLSCHGLVTQHGRLYFAATNTRSDRPGGSAVSRTFINEQLEDSHAGGRILLLDCCFSGAFGEGFKAGSTAALDGRVGQGYVVMTACDAFEYAYEEAQPLAGDVTPQSSIFTDVLVEGLVSGAADRDGDGRVAVDELFRHVHDAVVRRRPEQRPRFFAHAADSHLYLAKVPDSVASRQVGGGPDQVPQVDVPHAHLVAVERRFAAIAGPAARMLGPLGRRVLVPDGHGGSVETEDVLAVVSYLEGHQPKTDFAVGYMRNLAEVVERGAGDGTATAVILTADLVRSIARQSGHAEPAGIAHGIERAAQAVRDVLMTSAREIESKEDLEALGTTCTADPTLGHVIAEAFDMVGKEGAITVEPGRSPAPELEIDEGFRFGAGYVSVHFASHGGGAAVLNDPYILIADDELTALDDVLPIMERAVQAGRPLLVVAAGVDGDALAALVENHVRGILRAVAVRAPDTVADRAAFLGDLAAFTWGTVLGRGHGLDVRRADLSFLGRARKVVVERDSTVVADGTGDMDTVMARVEQIRAELGRATPGVEQDKLRTRLAQLAGGQARIRLGASGAVEAAERVRRAVRAIRVIRDAIDLGTVPGGGVALTGAAAAIDGLTLEEAEQKGATMLASSLAEPLLQLARSTDGDPLLTREDLHRLNVGEGVDVVTRRRVDVRDAGIVDSAHVLQSAVAAAASVAQRVLLSRAVL